VQHLQATTTTAIQNKKTIKRAANVRNTKHYWKESINDLYPAYSFCFGETAEGD